MAYKDKDKQREAVRQAVRRHRQGITQEPDVIPDTKYVIPKPLPKLLTIADVKAMSGAEAKAILDSWAEGHGTPYQRNLALLGRAYGKRMLI